jgi:hypothetical protein
LPSPNPLSEDSIWLLEAAPLPEICQLSFALRKNRKLEIKRFNLIELAIE